MYDWYTIRKYIRMLQKFHQPNLGLLLARIAVGLVFVFHGWQKLQNMDGTVGFFASLHLPATLAYIVMIIELLGGILMILGFFVRYVGILFAAVMVGVFATTSGGKISGLTGHDFEFVLLLVSLAIAFQGSGAYGLQFMIKKRSSSSE